LRTLFVLTLAVAAGLAWYALRRESTRRQKELVADKLAPYGADAQFNGGDVVQVAFSGDRFRKEAFDSLKELPQLKRLVLIGTPVGDDALARLGELPQCRELVIMDGKVTDAGLAYVGAMRQLTKLELHNLSLTDAGLEHLSGLHRLKRLDLTRLPDVTDEGLVHLETLRRLEMLFLTETPVSEEGVQALQRALPKTDISF
jgi:hypothetical protein